MDFTTIIIELISGAVGGNVAGAVNKSRSLGPLINSVLGAIGGVAGGAAMAGTAGDSTVSKVGISAVAGLILPLLAGFLKKKPA